MRKSRQIVAFASSGLLPYIAQEVSKMAKLILLQSIPTVYEAIGEHADIQMMPIEDRIFIDNDAYEHMLEYEANKEVLRELSELENKFVFVPGRLGRDYPSCVAFNGKYSEGVYIHHLKFCAPEILDYCRHHEIRLIHVNQGYTGCSLFMLNAGAAITADLGIARTLKKQGMEVLVIDAGKIRLEGLNYGFIGGCMGVCNKVVYVNGNLTVHPNGKEIIDFITGKGYRIVMDESSHELIDIGSILFHQLDKEEHYG